MQPPAGPPTCPGVHPTKGPHEVALLTLRWNKSPNGNWPALEDLNLEGLGEVTGIYVIWHGGGHPEWVLVGRGLIRQKLAQHRQDPRVQAHARQGLFVSWAPVCPSQLEGVEAYLVAYCQPLVGERPPYTTPISVNLPAT